MVRINRPKEEEEEEEEEEIYWPII